MFGERSADREAKATLTEGQAHDVLESRVVVCAEYEVRLDYLEHRFEVVSVGVVG